ncbi:MAG: 4'-phosphopantetheinyl transferase superfamily protein [Salinisphaera sp.]|nr:4'-phosphopantetheinyl transferase superfamily protein [Salinisphaera sp.]
MPPTATASVGLFQISRATDPRWLLQDVTAAERARYHALRARPRRARQYLASRWLVRAHLAREFGQQPGDVLLVHHANGPPTLPHTGYRLGLSHSGALCLCIASPCARVGCDVERQRPRRRLQELAAQYFHPAEAAHLRRVDGAPARRDFYRLWTLKEAAQKALGRGLDGGLRAPAFVLQPAMRCVDAPSAQPWTFASHRLTHAGEHYALALAIAGAPPPASFTVHDYAARASGAVSAHRQMTWQIAIGHGTMPVKANSHNANASNSARCKPSPHPQ